MRIKPFILSHGRGWFLVSVGNVGEATSFAKFAIENEHLTDTLEESMAFLIAIDRRVYLMENKRKGENHG